jgi:hypothetical protein
MNVKFFLICIVSCILVGCAVSAEKQREYRVIHDIGEFERTLKRIHEDDRPSVYSRYSQYEKPVHIILGGKTGEPVKLPYNYEFHEKFKEVMGFQTDKQISERENFIDELKRKSSVICITDVQCKKLFQLTQLFINEHSTRKIQLVTDTVIETYNPSDYGDIGFRAIKMPLDGTKSRVSITVLYGCSNTNKSCTERQSLIYKSFPLYMKSHL